MLDKLLQLVELFNTKKIDYCLIGGLAVLMHNGRANTVDMDFYVLVNDLKKLFPILKEAGIEARTAGEYQLKAKIDNTPIDILFADEFVGADVVTRAVPMILKDHVVKVATPEDLIILKTIANRSIDKRDIEELREIYGKKLDEDYVSKKLKEIEEMLK